ncbi:B'ETA, partial [Symbiodinium sp. CCMP2592]
PVLAWFTSRWLTAVFLQQRPVRACCLCFYLAAGPVFYPYGIFDFATYSIFDFTSQLDTYLQSDYSTRLGSLKAVHWELLLEGRKFDVPFTLADPILTVMHLLVHAGYHPHSVQFKFTHVEAPQHQPDKAGRPMLMVSLPFPAAAVRVSGAPAVAYFGHNTDLQAAFGILKEGCIRPSNYDPVDTSWLPSPAFYSRASVHSLSGALRAAAKFGGWGSPRPFCVYGRIPICYLDIANAAPTDTPSSVLPNTPAAYHLKSDSGGTVPENAANYFVSILHGNDNRWGALIPLLDLQYFQTAVVEQLWSLRPPWDHHRFLLIWIPPSARPYHDFADGTATIPEMKTVLALQTAIGIVIAGDVAQYRHLLLTHYLLALLLLRCHLPRDILMPTRSATQLHPPPSPSTLDALLHLRSMLTVLSFTCLSKPDHKFHLRGPQRRQLADPAVGVAAAIVLTETVMIVRILTALEVRVMFPIAIETAIDTDGM